MMQICQAQTIAQFSENLLYKLYLNKLEKPYLDVCMSQIPSIFVQWFKRKCVERRSLNKIMNIGHSY